jgi:hypothetical protein
MGARRRRQQDKPEKHREAAQRQQRVDHRNAPSWSRTGEYPVHDWRAASACNAGIKCEKLDDQPIGGARD